MKNLSTRQWRTTAAVLFAASLPSLAQAINFNTAANQTDDPAYHQPDYPLIFVSSPISMAPHYSGVGLVGDYHLGTGVLSAANPSGGGKLWILLPNGETKLLFPLPHHQQSGLIDSPADQLDSGAVVEPNMSEDGKRVYFSYFHNADNKVQQSYAPRSGADLYHIDLQPLLDNPATATESLTTTRLTSREYEADGTSISATELYKDAMNPELADSYVNNWGTVYMHPLEVRTKHGLKLIYSSDEKRLGNSNNAMGGYHNRNFNLQIADINDDGSISNARQYQYYTTTSALSPNRLRDGFAFSYQANVEDNRNWHIQGIDSAGQWYPLLGYGLGANLYHLSSFCVKNSGDNPGDYLVSTQYYNLNNEGFGSLWSLDLSQQGINTYDLQKTSGIVPQQAGTTLLTQGVDLADNVSDIKNGQYIGKFTSPRCGAADELYFAYTPTSANGRGRDNEDNFHVYQAYIGFRANLEPFDPTEAVDGNNGLGILKVVEDADQTHNLIWPLPVMSWQQRSGEAKQQVADPVVAMESGIEAGMPYANVGTSALWNTDRRPFDCWLTSGQTPYSPNKPENNVNGETEVVVNNTDGLTYIQNPDDFCEYLSPDYVFGVAINLTSNKIKTGGLDYQSASSRDRETSRLLGIYSVVDQADQSFKAQIPANAPFDMHLLHKQYGLKLADVRSWHSLKPEEERTDCGGCHQHEAGKAIAFANTVADQNSPLDMVNSTPYIDYDALCQPQMHTSQEPALAIPEWQTDIWPEFDQYCGSCHNSNASADDQALAALSYSDEESAYDTLQKRNYINHKLGAIGSPAWWAARAKRTDGRNNALEKYQPDYPNQVWGYHYSDIHNTAIDLCQGNNPNAASWVYHFGQWIDNHQPRDLRDDLFVAKFDRFHPTVASALPAGECSAQSINVGFWDDSGEIASLSVAVNNSTKATLSDLSNGMVSVALGSVEASDSISVMATDPAGNRQHYSMSYDELQFECKERQPQAGSFSITWLLSLSVLALWRRRLAA